MDAKALRISAYLRQNRVNCLFVGGYPGEKRPIYRRDDNCVNSEWNDAVHRIDLTKTAIPLFCVGCSRLDEHVNPIKEIINS